MTVAFPPPQMQRSHGEAAVSLGLRAGRVRIGALRQLGSAKAMLPQVGAVPEVVFLNTSGGLTGGDRLGYALSVGDALKAVATTQTAERAYCAGGRPAHVTVDLTVGRDGWLDWLPQETILYEAASLERRTMIDLARGAGCIALEAVVLGRSAMGEKVTSLRFHDRREIRRSGRTVMLEPLVLTDACLGRQVAVLGGARAFASLVMVAEGAEDAVASLRDVLDEPGVEAGASAFDGKLTVRLMAGDGWPLRRQIMRVLAVLRRAPLPRVWQMQGL